MKMKKAIIGMIAVFALLLMVLSVAADVTVTSTYDSDNPTFGSDTQRASNPDADDEDEEDEYDDASVSVRNDGNSSVTIDGISVNTASGFDEDDLQINLTSGVTLSANATGSLSMRARIPENLDAVNDDMEEVAFKVATVTLKDGSSNIGTFDVYMQRENMLIIEQIDVTVDDGNDEETTSIDGDDSGEEVEDVKPGSDVEIKVNAENLFDDNDNNDITIEDVEIRVESQDSDFDVDEEENIGDIDAETEEEKTVSFTVDDDTEEDDYDVDIDVVGEDEHGAQHGYRNTVGFQVERKSHEVVIRKASLTASSVSCSRSTTLEIKVQNIGSSDEDEIAVLATNRDLGLNFRQINIDLDGGEDSDSWTKNIPLSIGSSVDAGSYTIRVQTYYSGDEDDGVLGDDESVVLTVQDCSTDSSSEDSTDSSNDDTSSDDSDVEIIDTSVPTGTGNTDVVVPADGFTDVEETVEEKSFFDSIGYVALLVILVIGAIVGGVFLVLKFIA